MFINARLVPERLFFIEFALVTGNLLGIVVAIKDQPIFLFPQPEKRNEDPVLVGFAGIVIGPAL